MKKCPATRRRTAQEAVRTNKKFLRRTLIYTLLQLSALVVRTK
jgi:hypothetical protein